MKGRRVMIGETDTSFTIAFMPPLKAQAINMMNLDVPLRSPKIQEDGSQEFSFMRAYFGWTEDNPGHDDNRAEAFQVYAAKIVRQLLEPDYDPTLHQRERFDISLFAEFDTPAHADVS